MKRVLCVTVGVVFDLFDDTAGVGVPVSNGPLDDLAARLQREACFGRDCGEPSFTRPRVAAYVAAACRESSD